MIEPYYQTNNGVLFNCDALIGLKEMAPESVDCCVTSPPYWGLRDYGTEGQVWDGVEGCEHVWGDEQLSSFDKRTVADKSKASKLNISKDRSKSQSFIPNTGSISQGQFCQHCGAWRGSLGLEPTPELFVSHLVQIFREVKRVLKDSGTLFVNIGDSYSGSGEGGGGNRKGNEHGQHDIMKGKRPKSNLKPKDLVGIPWMLAFALRADGWWLRQDIIWAKGISFCDSYSGSVMPESVKDRFCNSYEHVFLLSKNKKYFFDLEAVKEKNANPLRTNYTPGKEAYSKGNVHDASGRERRNDGFEKYTKGEIPLGRTPRSVWAINPHNFKEAHFATFPPDLITPCIKAGSSEHGVCADCGKPWERVVERNNPSKKYNTGPDKRYEGMKNMGGNHQTVAGLHRNKGGVYSTAQTTGWQPTCKCKTTKRVPATVLDPFGGAGTTAIVAEKFDRSWVLIELSTEYCEIAKARIDQETRQQKLFPMRVSS